jgi:hypothetical protein
MFTKTTLSSLYSLFQLLAFVDLHFDPKRLNKHIHSIVIFCCKWYDNIGVLHGWLNKVVVRRLNKFAVLRQHVYNSPAAVCDIPLYSASESDVVRSQNEDFQVHFVSKPLLKNSVNALKHYNWRSFDSLHDIRPLVSRKVITRNLAVLSTEQFIYLFKGHVEVKRIRVIEVVQVCIIMVFFPKKEFE